MYDIDNNPSSLSVFKCKIWNIFPSYLSILLQDFEYLATGTFFMISGYGLAKSMEAHEPITLSYIYNHIRKLLCPFIFIYLIDVVIHTTLSGLDINLLLYNLFTLTLSDGGTLWFMKLIFLIYVFMSSLHLMIHNITIRLVFTILAFVTYVTLAGGYIKLYSQWWNSVLCFPLGYVFANLKCIMPKRSVGIRQIIATGGVFIVLYFLKITKCFGFIHRDCSMNTIILLMTSVIFAINSIVFVKVVNIRCHLLNYIGVNSLCFYLFHRYLVKFHLFLNEWQFVLLVLIGAVLLTMVYNRIERIIYGR